MDSFLNNILGGRKFGQKAFSEKDGIIYFIASNILNIYLLLSVLSLSSQLYLWWHDGQIPLSYVSIIFMFVAHFLYILYAYQNADKNQLRNSSIQIVVLIMITIARIFVGYKPCN